MSDSNITNRFHPTTYSSLLSNLPSLTRPLNPIQMAPTTDTFTSPFMRSSPQLESMSNMLFAPTTSQTFRTPTTTDDYTTFLSRYTTVYSTLNSPVNTDTQTRTRKELMEHQEKILDVLNAEGDENIEISEEMKILGFTSAEVKDFQAINKYVSKGRSLLLSYLEEHSECEKTNDTLKKRIEKTKEALGVIRYNLFSLEDNHVSFKELRNEFVTKMTQKETAVLEDLQSEQGILEIRKDKLQFAIRYLLTTYNILKSTATVHLCPICLTNEIDAFIDPCGHTLCTKCSSKITYCHMCRTKVKVAKSIYFS